MLENCSCAFEVFQRKLKKKKIWVKKKIYDNTWNKKRANFGRGQYGSDCGYDLSCV